MNKDKKTVILCEGTGCVSSESPAIQNALEQELTRSGIEGVEVINDISIIEIISALSI